MVYTLTAGSKAPQFCLPDKDEKKFCLKDFKEKWVVLYFYPKDNTSGCTKEAVDFTAHAREFVKLNAVVIGISPDPPKSHANFIQKHKLRVILLSDQEHAVLKEYGVWQKKKMYGREYHGAVRTTFLIDPSGEIVHVWEGVRVNGHVSDVHATLGRSHTGH